MPTTIRIKEPYIFSVSVPYQPIMFIMYNLRISIYLLIIAHIMVTLEYPWPLLVLEPPLTYVMVLT